MKRIVYLPEGRQVSLSTYVRAWKRTLAAQPKTLFENGFNWYPESREDILREFRRGLHDRINRRIDGFPGTHFVRHDFHRDANGPTNGKQKHTGQPSS